MLPAAVGVSSSGTLATVWLISRAGTTKVILVVGHIPLLTEPYRYPFAMVVPMPSDKACHSSQ